ncbi:carboxymuconolactone decarboxylase family protein [Acinetobacter pragensis]|uniref:4-carboxymuconolactone decarboxylase n=1 Tax=Acinetobacter pragensis TaxID=1806892 RepID=A0A151Y3U4_9GAMM|nr:carboxymuconolactone decarboxylase family protein [Acinetobacter pragensis]KYQ72714.1 4-carboxymuconolactone decarboxylase [Acinetobacter pragensis]
MNHAIKQKHQAMIPIAAFSAVGNQPKLAQALRQGLDQGLTINQIKSLLVQSYAYAGFPRSLNALATFMQVLEQRKAQGIHDIDGAASTPLAQDYQALVQGTQNQSQLAGQSVQGPLFEFSPEIDEYLKAHLFGDIFSKDVLNWEEREIATVSMLAAMDGVESQLRSHLILAQKQGISMRQLQAVGLILSELVSVEAGQRLEAELPQLSAQ